MLNIKEVEAQAQENRLLWIKNLVLGKSNPYTHSIYIKPGDLDWAEWRMSAKKDYILCATCHWSENLCEHNPFIKTALQHQADEARRVKSVVVHEVEDEVVIETRDEDDAPIARVTTVTTVTAESTGRRGRAKLVQEITPELVQEAIGLLKGGLGMVAAAQQLNVNPAELSVELKAQGVILQRGKKPQFA